MSLIDQKIRAYEARPAQFDSTEQIQRSAMIQHFSAINKFEGIIPNSTDERLFSLLIAGKINKQEYLDLCLDYARSIH
jgi:hypothetical protein